MGRSKVAAWLKDLPLAPEYHPSEEEFQNPIAYIMKIEEEASKYGICKIVPPFGKASKKEVLWNLNHSLVAHQGLVSLPVNENSTIPSNAFTLHQKEDLTDVMNLKGAKKGKISTRLQQLGTNHRSSEGGSQYPAQKMVWETGEEYTLEQYEVKAKYYAEARLSRQKDTTPLVLETLFWKAAAESPTYIEYANDIPGTAFANSLVDLITESSRKGQTCASELHFRKSSLGLDCKGGCHSSERLPKDSKATDSCGEAISNHMDSDAFRPSETLSEGRQSMENELFRERKGASSVRLASSAWNMRYFARSPGSLLRFLPDDVPGVTSPMIYLGMLFSWFAWHIEDHELHSINYLHMGQPKTWYAVPSVAATAFEEFVRVTGYGGLVDNRATLELLGAKTTVMSPEVLIAAGLPCCRLVQNAGDYVVTFPRAYHLGFSHGFNCGEAANFATATWLRIAKEAALRRASMKHLPMLSHQQLLYSMAMSLPTRPIHEPYHYAKRCREIGLGEDKIKKIFVEDAIQSNDAIFRLLSTGMSTCVLLKKYQSELFDLGATKFPTVQNSLISATVLADNHSTFEKGALSEPLSMKVLQNRDTSASEDKPLLASLCKANHLGLTESTFLQYDWGTLPCTICGVLSFANFAIIQPLGLNLQEKEGNNDQTTPTLKTATSAGVTSQAVTKLVSSVPWDNSTFLGTEDGSSQLSPSETGMVTLAMNDLNAEVDGNHLLSSRKQLLKSYEDGSDLENGEDAVSEERDCVPCSQNQWRPKVFCLEHALIVQKQLQRFGGSDVLVICNSRFTEIQGHAKDLADLMKLTYAWKDYPVSEVFPAQLKLFKAVQESEEGGNQTFFNWVTLLPISAVETGDKSMKMSIAAGYSMQEVHDTVSNEMKQDSISLQASKKRKEVPDVELACQKVRWVENDRELPDFEEKSEQLPKCMETPNESTVSVINAKPGETAGLLPEKCKTKIVIRLKRHSDSYSNFKHKQIKVVPEEYSGEILGSDCTGIRFKDSHILADHSRKGQEDARESFQRVSSSRENQEPCSKNFSRPTSFFSKVDDTLDTGFPKKEYQITKGNKKDGLFQNALECQILSLSRGKHRVLKRKSAGCSTPQEYHDKTLSVCPQSSLKGCLPRPVDGNKQNDWETPGQVTDKKSGCDFNDIDDQCHRPKTRLQSRHVQRGMKNFEFTQKGASGALATKSVRKNISHVTAEVHKRSLKNQYKCKIDGCTMSFSTKTELANHKNNVCVIEGCGKQFSTHKYLVQHQRVHVDNRPLKCTWPGCEISFKWAWARTEHMRVHTGARPYSCSVCNKTYRFLSDFSRHKRTTGHNTKE